MNRLTMLLLLLAAAPGCGGTTEDPGDGDGDVDGDVDADSDADADGDGNCTDLDADGFGIGDTCEGDDCDDSDPALTNQCGSDGLCEAGVHVTGCPCDVAQPTVCYTGPEGTGGVGACSAGLRDCVDGVFAPCEGQVLPQEETCEDTDQNCDGQVDEGVQSACGNCQPDCADESVGVSADHEFDPDSPGARGVVQLPDGSITLGNTVVIANRVIWIANSGQGTVSKIDTTTNEELGRYYTDPNQSGDPSRSTVNPHGDVISANRQTASATFIMASECPDQDGDGIVETSTGPDDILPWGDDECVIWHLAWADFGDARGSAIEERIELDGLMHEYAWIGSFGTGNMYEIDVEAGEFTGREFNSSPASPYGAAMGPDHTLWVTTSGSNMAKIDTETLDITQYTAPAGRSFYGITVDRDGFPWLSGWNGAQRFDPNTEEFTLVEGGCGGGIAADVDGFVWTGHGYICEPDGVARIDPATMIAEVIQTGGDTHGVAIDFDGFVWAINVNDGNAHKIDPDTLEFEVAWTSGINYNYTYSDMTGYQLINATQEIAEYAWVFTGCEGDEQTTEWATLSWEADTPAGTTVSFTGRTADTLQGLAAAQRVPIAAQPPDESPVSINDAFIEAGVTQGTYLEVAASLTSAARDQAPILRVFTVSHSCSGIFQ